jgi:glycogen operon protein
MDTLPGSQFPLGATATDGGVNFAVASGVADGMVLCLFDETGAETRIPIRDYDAGVWHVFVPGVGAGQAYGYRATGPYAPASGVRCNPSKLLLDPYARALHGTVTFGPELLGYSDSDPDSPSTTDSAGNVPRSLVVAEESFPWNNGAQWRHSYADTVIYEVHVKGFTMRHPRVPLELRGTYAGLGHDAAIAHLRDLGVTAVELLPVHESIPESFLPQRGLTNYWGYNTIGYFAPHQGYSAAVRAGQPGGQVTEFKAMVDALHSAGLEVLLDVVFNHTCEGSDTGPTFCFRGLDNPAYYRLAENPRHYIDTTGCGNSLNAGDPTTLQLIMDSLRYWLTEMRVDGFRFDLARTRARQEGGYDNVSAFLSMVAQDPVVSRAKMVAEPWDAWEMDSHGLGRYPPLWREWNGKYRDTMRDFWGSHPVGIGEFAERFAGSADLYGTTGRQPTASVNLITVHDGFTLADLVSYNDKHNEANGENNNDGTSDNRSWNCGAEGPTDDPTVLALRARQSRAMLATLLLSFGIPMLLGGDEMGRTQQGNNNAYCQDNEITWFDWSQPDTGLQDFTKRLIALRRAHPVFRRARFLAGTEAAELRWFTPSGTEMTDADWADQNALAIALYLDGSDDPDRAADGTWLVDDDFLVLVNAWWEPLDFTLPATRPQAIWQVEIDTYDPAPQAGAATDDRKVGDGITVGPRSVVVLKDPRGQVPQ